MICLICGKEFEKIGKQKYCSKECSKLARKAQITKWRKDNSEKEKIRMVKYYKEHAQEIKIQRIKYRKDHSKEIKVQNVKYYKEHIEEIRAQHTKYDKEHVKEIKIRKSKYGKTLKGKEILKRAIYKRQHKLGFNPLNKYFNGSEAHHINKNDVIYIPKLWHFKGHSVIKNYNMEPINTVAFFFLLIQNIDVFSKL